MDWGGVAYLAVIGLVLLAGARSFARTGDAGRDARLTRGYSGAGAALLHVAALGAVLKLVSGQ